MGKIVTLGEVVSDIYRGEEISDVELGFVARPGGAPANVAVAASRRGAAAAVVGRGGRARFGGVFLRALWESREAAREAVDPLLDLSTIVKLGDDELDPLLGVGDVEEAAQKLLGRGVALVLISKGPDGAFYATPDFSGEVPTFEIEDVVDATGAGDAFLAASLVHLSDAPFDEERVREAALRGCAAGALACTAFGAMRALPTKDELEKFMAGG